MGFIDAHVHVWTPDNAYDPLRVARNLLRVEPTDYCPHFSIRQGHHSGENDNVRLVQDSPCRAGSLLR